MVDLIMDYLASVLEQINFEVDLAFLVYDNQVDLLYFADGDTQADIKACRVFESEDGFSALPLGEYLFAYQKEDSKLSSMVDFIRKLAERKRSKAEKTGFHANQMAGLGNRLDKALLILGEIFAPRGAKVFVFNYNTVRSGEYAIPTEAEMVALQKSMTSIQNEKATNLFRSNVSTVISRRTPNTSY